MAQRGKQRTIWALCYSCLRRISNLICCTHNRSRFPCFSKIVTVNACKTCRKVCVLTTTEPKRKNQCGIFSQADSVARRNCPKRHGPLVSKLLYKCGQFTRLCKCLPTVWTFAHKQFPIVFTPKEPDRIVRTCDHQRIMQKGFFRTADERLYWREVFSAIAASTQQNCALIGTVFPSFPI